LLDYSSNNSISGNNITANNWYGIWLYSSSNNSISGNNIANNYGGIWLDYSSSNSISGNNIANNEYGIRLSSSSNNVIYHNNFIDNTQQVGIQTSGYANVWDDGYPSGGNYWSDYIGVDVKSGPSQDLPGSDGIGDVPYIIDADNVDHYPLMNPYGAPPPQTYSLTITTTTGGTTNPAPGTYTHAAGSSVQVTAIPSTGYVLDHWELDSVNVGSANPYSVLMDNNHTLHAVFKDTTPPAITIISPQNITYTTSSVPLTFTINEPTSWIGYSLDGQANVTISGNTTLTGLSEGSHNIIVYANDTSGNMGASNRVYFTIAPPTGVGGIWIPVDKLVLLAPYIALTSAIILAIAATAVFFKYRKKH
jgi:parallel beta-helix repeat protein